MEKIVKMYDGYRFEETVAHVFNPVSVGKCLSSGKFGEYWFETGTPTFLLQLFSEAPEQVDGVTLDASAISVYEPSAPARSLRSRASRSTPRCATSPTAG